MKYVLIIVLLLMLSACGGEETDQDLALLAEQYDVNISEREHTEDDSSSLPEFDREQVEGLFAYMYAFYEEGDNEYTSFEINDFQAVDDGIRYRLLLDADQDLDGDYDLNRAVELTIDDTSEEVTVHNIATEFEGGEGLTWEDDPYYVVDQEGEAASIEIYGKWYAEFIFEDSVVSLEQSDLWRVEVERGMEE